MSDDVKQLTVERTRQDWRYAYLCASESTKARAEELATYAESALARTEASLSFASQGSAGAYLDNESLLAIRHTLEIARAALAPQEGAGEPVAWGVFDRLGDCCGYYDDEPNAKKAATDFDIDWSDDAPHVAAPLIRATPPAGEPQEPGAVIALIPCPCCGAAFSIEYGSDEGQIVAYGDAAPGSGATEEGTTDE